jgi:hypothetical protein
MFERVAVYDPALVFKPNHDESFPTP